MIRMTVGELKKKLEEYKVPDSAIVCCQSDEEGNRTMVCCECFIEKVGMVNKETYYGQEITWTSGEDVEGIDMTKDKDKKFIILRPLY